MEWGRPSQNTRCTPSCQWGPGVLAGGGMCSRWVRPQLRHLGLAMTLRQCCVSQSAALGPAASASPGILLEMQILRPLQPRPAGPEAPGVGPRPVATSLPDARAGRRITGLTWTHTTGRLAGSFRPLQSGCGETKGAVSMNVRGRCKGLNVHASPPPFTWRNPAPQCNRGAVGGE